MGGTLARQAVGCGVDVYPMHSSTGNKPVDHRYFYAVPGDSAIPRYHFCVLYTRQGASDNYEAEANYRYAQNLKGKLLLTTGDMDCNNPAAETLRLVDALEKAGKDCDFLLLTDTGHQPPTYAIKQVWDYFVRHLLGATPPTDYRMIPP